LTYLFLYIGSKGVY